MILLDTGVMIDLLRQYPPAVTWFDTLDEDAALSYETCPSRPFCRSAVTFPTSISKSIGFAT